MKIAILKEVYMSEILEPAQRFFDACETGKGWEVCKEFCLPGATFAAQTKVLAEIKTLEEYCEWMRDLFTPIPDGHYELHSFSVDESRNNVTAYAVFYGTHTGPNGPVAATDKSIAADYVYVMTFQGDRISHLTKIWNDTYTMQHLGWI